MRSYLAAFVVATVLGALLTPLVRRLALALGAVAAPGGRHVHRLSIPRLGGIAIALAFSAPLVGLFFVDGVIASAFRELSRLVIGLLVGATAMCVVGVVDDTRGVRALYKLAAQVVCAAGAFAAGFRIEAIALPFGGELSMGVFALPVTVLWIVGVTNAVNLIDGLDGLAAGVVFFASLTNFVVALISGNPLIGVLMAAMMGSLIGFLFYNFNPARIFMGDSGSYFLGFVLATTSLAGASQKASTAVALLVPVVALGVPIFDTLFSIVRRWLERRPLFSPDRGHIHHRLLDMGLTHRRAVLSLYAVSVLFTVASIAISLGRSWQVGAALLGATVVMMGLVRSVGYFDYLHLRKRQKARLYDRHTERLRRVLPELPARVASTSTTAELWLVLSEAAAVADLAYFEVLHAVDGVEQVAHRWARDASYENARDLVSARFPLGRDDNAVATLKFGWRSESEDVSPQADVLLQVVTDVVESQLGRLGSELAARRSEDSQKLMAATTARLTRPSNA